MSRGPRSWESNGVESLACGCLECSPGVDRLNCPLEASEQIRVLGLYFRAVIPKPDPSSEVPGATETTDSGFRPGCLFGTKSPFLLTSPSASFLWLLPPSPHVLLKPFSPKWPLALHPHLDPSLCCTEPLSFLSALIPTFKASGLLCEPAPPQMIMWGAGEPLLQLVPPPRPNSSDFCKASLFSALPFCLQ